MSLQFSYTSYKDILKIPVLDIRYLQGALLIKVTSQKEIALNLKWCIS